MEILYTSVNNERGVPIQGYAEIDRTLHKAIYKNTGELRGGQVLWVILDSQARTVFRQDESLAAWKMATAKQIETIV